MLSESRVVLDPIHGNAASSPPCGFCIPEVNQPWTENRQGMFRICAEHGLLLLVDMLWQRFTYR